MKLQHPENELLMRRRRSRERRVRSLFALAAVAGIPSMGAAAPQRRVGHGRGTLHAHGGAATAPERPAAPGEVNDAPGPAINAPLTTAAAVRALTPDHAEQALPVKVRGVITCAGSLIFIQDATAGIFIDAPVSTKNRYQVGQYGDLEGFTAPGLFAPQTVTRR